MTEILKEPNLASILDLFKYAAKKGAGSVKIHWDVGWYGIEIDDQFDNKRIAELETAYSSIFSFQEKILHLDPFDASPSVPFSLATLGVSCDEVIMIGRKQQFDRNRILEFTLTQNQRDALLAKPD